MVESAHPQVMVADDAHPAPKADAGLDTHLAGVARACDLPARAMMEEAKINALPL